MELAGAGTAAAAGSRALSREAALVKVAPGCLELLWRAATHAPQALADSESGELASQLHTAMLKSLELLGALSHHPARGAFQTTEARRA